MEGTRKRILFVTPYFGRSGSEMQLFYILQNLDQTRIKPFLFSRDNGLLLKDLNPNVQHFVGYKQHPNFLYRVLRLLLYAINVNPTEFQLRILNWRLKPDYWYINSLKNRDSYELARKLKIKVISHIHELPLAYGLFKSRTIETAMSSQLCIGCSEIVCEKFRDMGHKNVHLLYGFVDEKKVVLNPDVGDLRSQFGFTAKDFVWVVSGNTSTIKGVDFLIPLLKKLPDNHKIIWIGAIEAGGTMFYAESAIATSFSNRVFFVGKKEDDYYDYFNLGHAFLSISREDSFPLVMLEAAHLAKPIAGFNSGGIKEFVNEEIGIVVDQLDFSELANAMENIERNYHFYEHEKIKSFARKLNVKEQVEKLTKLIESYI